MEQTGHFNWLARAGYAARGIVFLLVAGLALFSGIGSGEPDTRSALRTVLEQPLGQVWLALIGLGLVAFVLWRGAQSLGDADRHGTGAKGLAIRAALAGSAITYAGLAFTAFAAVLHLGSGGGSGEKGLAAWAMAQPFGPALAGAIGLGFVIGGGVTIWKGITRRFLRYLRLSDDAQNPLVLLSVYGLVARGVVFAIIGLFFCYAAFTLDPQQAGSTADALDWVRRLPFGGILFVLVAAGLAAFGLYNFIEARYRVIKPPQEPALPAALTPGRS